MLLFRILCVAIGILSFTQAELMSDSLWRSALAPLGVICSILLFLLSFPIERYRKNPARFAAEAREARRRANERGSSYDGGMD